MLAADAEGCHGWTRLLRQQQLLLQLDLLLQLHQDRRLHAVPESSGGQPGEPRTPHANAETQAGLGLGSETYFEMMRPISSRQRQTCRGSLCRTDDRKQMVRVHPPLTAGVYTETKYQEIFQNPPTLLVIHGFLQVSIKTTEIPKD